MLLTLSSSSFPRVLRGMKSAIHIPIICYSHKNKPSKGVLCKALRNHTYETTSSKGETEQSSIRRPLPSPVEASGHPLSSSMFGGRLDRGGGTYR